MLFILKIYFIFIAFITLGQGFDVIILLRKLPCNTSGRSLLIHSLISLLILENLSPKMKKL